ncbi:MAG: DUF2306 domain-containing protein [Alphaproteobacteria bacterium]
MTTLGAAHLTAAIAALAFGSAVLLARKGTHDHRAMGAAFVAAMLATNLTALGIFQLTGTFGPFHALALAGLAILARGVIAVLRRRPGWLTTHYYCMAWSYIGLLAASCTEIIARVPFGLVQSARDGLIVGLVCTAVFLVIGLIVLPRLAARTLGSVRP